MKPVLVAFSITLNLGPKLCPRLILVSSAMLIINFTNLAFPSLSAFVTDSSSYFLDLFLLLPGGGDGSSDLPGLLPDPEGSSELTGLLPDPEGSSEFTVVAPDPEGSSELTGPLPDPELTGLLPDPELTWLL